MPPAVISAVNLQTQKYKITLSPAFADSLSEVVKGSNRDDISTAPLPENRHDKGYYAKGVFLGRVAELNPLKQGLKLYGW